MLETSLEGLPLGWTLRSIESLCRRVTSGGTPLRSNPAFYAAGKIPWFKTQELKDWYLDDSQEHITEEALASSSAKLFPPGTILMAMYGDGRTITSLGILRREAASNQACCALIVDPSAVDHLYLFYALKFHRNDFLRLATGGAQRNLSGSLIRNFGIRVPPVREQRAVGVILGALDGRVEVNRRMNQTLEAMARAIFKSWFVDTEANSTTDSGLADLVVLHREVLEPSSSPGEWFDHYSIPAFDESRYPVRELGGDIKSNKFLVPEGAILLSKLNPRIPRVWRPRLGKERRSISSTEFLVVTPRQRKADRDFLYSLFCSREFMDVFASCATGTSGSHQRVRPEDLLAMNWAIPDPELRIRYSKTVEPMFDRIDANLEESRTLAALRDALLPKLLSGEIRVKQAEKIVGEVV